jgi:cell division transport system ATP-binding protein
MIDLRNVTKRYPGGHEALRNASFAVERGEMVFVMGHSGAGKTTLLKLIAGIERPSGGTVLVNGQNVGAMKARALPYLRRNLGMVFQDHKLLYDRDAFANVMLPLEIHGYERREAAKRARAALDKVGLLAHEKAMPITLSGGEQQRLCIARAVVHRPALLLADEPTGNLDAAYASEIGELFRSFNQVGATVVIATHDHQLAERLAPRLVTIAEGRVDAIPAAGAAMFEAGSAEHRGATDLPGRVEPS